MIRREKKLVEVRDFDGGCCCVAASEISGEIHAKALLLEAVDSTRSIVIFMTHSF